MTSSTMCGLVRRPRGTARAARGTDEPVTVALHFVNVAQHLYVRRCVPQRPPAFDNAARLKRSDFARRDQMRCGQVSIFDGAIPISRALVQLLSSSTACDRLSDNNLALFHDRTIWRCPCSAVNARRLPRADVRSSGHLALDTLFRSVDYARRRSGRDDELSRRRSHGP